MKLINLYPQLAAQFDSIKNAGIDLNDLDCWSNKKIWWKCASAHDHEWQAVIAWRVRKNSQCPFCANKKVCLSNCLATTHPDLAKEWNNRNILSPVDIVAGSCRKIWWQCKRGHEWQATVRDRSGVRDNRKRGCPYCANQKVCLDNCLEKTHPELLLDWDFEKNLINPNEITYGSRKKIWWKCFNCKHSWQSCVNHRTDNCKRGCPVCANVSKSEKMSLLISNGWTNYKSKYEFGWFFSEKNNKNHFYRSSYEKKVFDILEQTVDVSSYETEKIRIPYSKSGQNRIYVPDLLIHYKNMNSKLVEIKPKNFVNDEINKIKFESASEYVKKYGWTFEVWTEDDFDV